VHPEDILSEEPEATELVKLVDELPSPSANEIGELKRQLESLKDLPAADWPVYLRDPLAKLDVRHPEPATSHRRLTGPAVVLVKRAFRLVFQPLINEVLRKQVEFNEAVLGAVVQIHENLQQHLRNQALWAQEIEKRLERLERGASTSSDAERISEVPRERG
jgi:hypothetical protein